MVHLHSGIDAFFFGTAIGYLFGQALHVLLLGTSSAPFAFALVVMGSILGGPHQRAADGDSDDFLGDAELSCGVAVDVFLRGRLLYLAQHQWRPDVQDHHQAQP